MAGCYHAELIFAESVNVTYVFCRDVNEYSNVRIFAFHTNIRMRFLDSNIRIFF